MSIRQAALRRAFPLCCVVLTVVGVPSAALGASAGVRTVATPGPASAFLAFSVDTNLLSPSNLSAWQIDRYLAAQTSLPPLGSAFKAAETRYGVNARYLLALAMHESGFGRSVIARRYHNLFGWHANDRNPLAHAGRFATFAEGIDVVASQIAAQYLHRSGQYYGGAPTLRGMRGYASDPNWSGAIAAVANSIVVPSLRGVTIRFGALTASGALESGRPTIVTATTVPGMPDLPAGLRVAARFRPIAIVEAHAPPAIQPDADPPFALVDGSTDAGRITARVTAPSNPGRYELDLQVRDSDGTILRDGSQITLPGLTTRVYGRDAVTYSVHHSTVGLSLAVTNVGRTTIPAQGGALADPTRLIVWALPDAGPATRVVSLPLGEDLLPGATWTGQLPNSTFSGLVPGYVLLRLVVGGAPDRPSGSPPAAIRISAVPPTLGGAVGPDASTLSGSTGSALGPTRDPTDLDGLYLDLQPLDPKDPGTATGPESQPPIDRPLPTSTDSVQYTMSVDQTSGEATVTVTNTGTATMHALGPVAAATVAGSPPVSVVTTALVVSAIPASGAEGSPIELQVPLPGDLAPGEAVTLPLSLPVPVAGQVSYLVLARVVPATPAEAFSSAGTVFWLRGPAPALPPVAAPVPPQ